MTKTLRAQSRYKPRSPEQKARRQTLWIAQETMRRDTATRRSLARYEELKIEMARHGSNIGPIEDLQAIDDPQRYADVLKARVERWDALWSITKRKKDTRGKIIIGGAILAELADLDLTTKADQTLLSRIVDLLDRRVERVRDRTILRYLLTASTQAEIQLPLRIGGPLNEDLNTALKAAGESFYDYDRQALVHSAAGDLGNNSDDDLGALSDGEILGLELKIQSQEQYGKPIDRPVLEDLAKLKNSMSFSKPASDSGSEGSGQTDEGFSLKEPAVLNETLEKLREDFGNV